MSSPMKSPRILFFTGKGGLGKITVSAATAVLAADLGYRTLVMSAAPAHSLGDALDRTLGPEPGEVLPNLYAQEIDLYYSMQKHWSSLRKLLLGLLKWHGVDDVIAEELAAPPGMAEASVFLWVEEVHRNRDFDLIVIDSAATAESIALLGLPQVSRW